MTNTLTVALPQPVAVIAERLQFACIGEKHSQTAFAVIGALDQSGWAIVRKRHARKP
jgi:hypothetical protein